MRSVKARSWAFIVTVGVTVGLGLALIVPFSGTGSADSARTKQTTKTTFTPTPPSCVPTLTPDDVIPCPSYAAPGATFEGVQIAFDTAITYVQLVQVHAQQAAEAAAQEAARAAQPQQQATSEETTSVDASASGTGGCASGGGGNWAVPEYIVNRESGGDYCARNSSGACGAYQIMPDTWGGYGGYSSACDAPPAVQDEKASGMAACNWEAPNYCAG